MIEESRLLQVRREIVRPDPAIIARFRGVPTEHLADAMDGRGALNHRIKALDPGRAAFVGPALTCLCGPGDNLAVAAALAFLQPGDVIVAAADAFAGLAVIGRRIAGMARNRRAAALVTDGLVRDVAGLRASSLPVFSCGVTPNSANASGPGTVGEPVVVGGVAVSPGDVVVGDEAGIVVVPRMRIDDVLTRLEGVRAREADLAAKLAAGLGVPRRVTELLESGQVRYLK